MFNNFNQSNKLNMDKVNNSKKNSNQNNNMVIRKEVMNDLNKKDMEIKELKEQILSLKVEKSVMDNSSLSVLNMNFIREEIKVADKFIKEVMKENLDNYDLIAKMEEENCKTEVMDDAEKKKIVKRFEKDLLTRINFDNCGCNTCILNKGMLNSFLGKEKNMFVKNFNLTDRIYMASHYDSMNLKLEMRSVDRKAKELVFKNVNSEKDMVRIKFFWRKESENKKIIVKFDNHMSTAMTLRNCDLNFRVSMSSYLVIKAMRETLVNPLMELEKIDKIKDIKEMSCFSKMFLDLMGKKPVNEMSVCMNDLIEEEEMELITNFGDTDVYYMIDQGSMTSTKNHISKVFFAKSNSIKLYMISTPLMRSTFFFAEDSDEFVTVERDTMLLVDQDEECTEQTNITSGSLSRGFFRSIRKKSIKFVGKICGDFYKSVFIKRNSDKGLDLVNLKNLLESNLADNFMQSFNLEPMMLALFNMSYEQFLSVLYFSSSLNKVVDMTLNKDLKLMVQCLTNSKNMFIEMLVDDKDLDLDQTTIRKEWSNFLKELPDSVMFSDDLFKRLFWEFKRRVYMHIIMSSIMRDNSGNMNSLANTQDWLRKKEENRYTNRYLERLKSVDSSKRTDITNFQPTAKIKDLKKLIPLAIDKDSIEMMNHMAEEFLEDEN